MLTASSPITYPHSSSPPLKRPFAPPSYAGDVAQKPKARTRGGFMLDDDSDEDGEADEESLIGPAPKRILVDAQHWRTESTLSSAEPSQPAEAAATSQTQTQTQTVSQLDATPYIPDAQPLDLDAEEELRYQALLDRQPSQPSLFDRDYETFSTLTTALTRPRAVEAVTCSGRSVPIKQRKPAVAQSYETMVADRSRTKAGRARRAYYGIELHALVDAATKELKDQREKEKAASASATSEGASPAQAPRTHPDQPVRSVEKDGKKSARKSLLWTEKYRARNFMDLVGDDLTNRQVLRWLKRWDPLVFPHAAKSKAASRRANKPPQQGQHQQHQQQQWADGEQKPHRKILMLTGPPGLGKTTLAHVCARQAGYEVLEINASDDRSRDVVRGRIRTSLGTENVRTVEQGKTCATDSKATAAAAKVARPVCVVVDEVDGVVSGSSGSGEGGFVKALIDLVLTDQKNSAAAAAASSSSSSARKKRKGDDFRQMRPLILICNDVYHASLRPLRQSGLAEIIHVGKPPVEAVVARLKAVFEKEGIPCEKDAARKLCEAAWGMASGVEARRGAESNVEGDLRGIMVVGEWVAGRVRACGGSGGGSIPLRLTRQWVEQNVARELSHGGGGARGLGRGGTRDIVSRVFQEGAGFPKQSGASAGAATTGNNDNNNNNNNNGAPRREQPQTQLGFAEQHKKYAMARLGEMVDTSGEVDRILTEVFAEWPEREFNDDCYLSKPDAAYEWMHFHDACSSRVYSSQEWELAPYMSQPVLACHHLFASPRRHVPLTATTAWGAAAGAAGEDRNNGDASAAAPLPFSGPRADYAAREAEKHNRAALQAMQAGLSPSLARAFRSPEQVATDLLPYLARLVSPDVKPVVVGGGGGGGSGGFGGGDGKGLGAMASVRRESEKAMVRRAAEVLAEVGVELVKGRIEDVNPVVGGRAQWVYRMEPDLDALSTFETMGALVLAAQAPTRYAVRQVVDQELQRTLAARQSAARMARLRGGVAIGAGGGGDGEQQEDILSDDKENRNLAGKASTVRQKGLAGTTVAVIVKRDFFGRIIVETAQPLRDVDGNGNPVRGGGKTDGQDDKMVWVTFNEGLNNAVRKPITLEEFLRGL